MSTVQRPWRGVPSDERQVERRRRLFEATLGLAETSGLAAVTVRGVCALAGLTSRYFYESFSDTNDLLISLYEELAEQAMTNTAQAMSTAGTDLRSRIRNGVQAGITFVVEDDRRSRYLLVHATAVPELNRRRRQLIGHVAESWAKTVQPAYDFADESSALAAVSRFVVGGLIELSTAFVQGDVVMPADDLVESITDMAIAAIEAIALRSPTSS